MKDDDVDNDCCRVEVCWVKPQMVKNRSMCTHCMCYTSGLHYIIIVMHDSYLVESTSNNIILSLHARTHLKSTTAKLSHFFALLQCRE